MKKRDQTTLLDLHSKKWGSTDPLLPCLQRRGWDFQSGWSKGWEGAKCGSVGHFSFAPPAAV